MKHDELVARLRNPDENTSLFAAADAIEALQAQLAAARAYIDKMIPCSSCNRIDACLSQQDCATHRNWREALAGGGQ